MSYYNSVNTPGAATGEKRGEDEDRNRMLIATPAPAAAAATTAQQTSLTTTSNERRRGSAQSTPVTGKTSHVSHRGTGGAAAAVTDFEQKLVETDAYLQIVIDQLKDLDKRIDKSVTEDEKIRLVDIKAKTLELLENVKHTIVLLQIAKVRVHTLMFVFVSFSTFFIQE